VSRWQEIAQRNPDRFVWVEGQPHPIIAGGGSGSGGGETTVQSQIAFDPTIQALQTARLGLAQNLMAGNIPSMMSGFLNKVLVPSTMNAATAGGMGRSGAVTEAVSNAIFSQGSGMLTQLLTGVPGSTPSTEKQKSGYEPGFFDYFGSIMGAICKLGRAIYGGETFEVTVMRGWLFQHPRVAKLYARFGGYFVPVAWMFRPVFQGLVQRELRKVACA